MEYRGLYKVNGISKIKFEIKQKPIWIGTTLIKNIHPGREINLSTLSSSYQYYPAYIK